MNKTHLILAKKVNKKKNEKIVFLSHRGLVRLGLLFWLSTGISKAYQELTQSSTMDLEDVNYFFKRLILDVWPSSVWPFVFTFYFVSGTVQP